MTGLIQRKQLAQCWLIDLNNSNSGVLEIGDLVAQSQTDLISNLSQRQIIAREGPGDDGDRTSQHALNRVISQRLRVTCPFNSHCVRTDNIPPQDRRTCASRTIRLDPAVLRCSETFKLFSKVLNHIVTLCFAVDQNIQTEVFLKANHRFNLFTHTLRVVFVRELALGPSGTSATNFLRLREGTNGGGRNEGQTKTLTLKLIADCEVFTLTIGLGQARNALTQLGANHARCGSALSQNLTGRFNGLGNGIPTIVHTTGKGDNLPDLLVRESEPCVKVRIEHGVIPLLQCGVMGNVLQRGRGRNGERCRVQGLGCIEASDGAIQIGSPDVTTINNASNQSDLGQVN